MTAPSESNFANRILVAAANATFICLVFNVACVFGFLISVLVNNADLFELFFPRDFWLSLSIRPAVPVMRFLSPLFLYVWLLLVSIFAPALICKASTKLGRQEKLVGLGGVLSRARKLGLLSALLAGAVVVPTVMFVNNFFGNWSIVYFLAQIWFAPLAYLIALMIVQLILQTEGELVLPKFCSIEKPKVSWNSALICIALFLVAIAILAGPLFFAPSYFVPLFRDKAVYLVLFELVGWLVAGLSLLRNMILDNFMVVYFFCFVLPSVVLLILLPAFVICISVH
ncbi:MAG: hypothetical protein QG574_4502 [Cyanobacteriota bacterium erpe_2018_sw_21hr_WHONDRS-SW48-000092_B_bin.40]|jgi:hypothetical protein|nr:hypothetical protein [Cyanobacteriota bacterium erpe_2018_sw_21hr_WHONDRS-SW48-000092_B_bin.40]